MLSQPEAEEITSVDRVLLAAPRSFCAGVEMAIKALAWMVRTFDPPVYCYHEIVHNRLVVERFRRAGVVFVDDVDDVPDGAPLMLSAHGSAPEVVRAARSRSALVVDAVCPLVQKVHHELRQRSDKGHAIVYAGHATHDEAVGTLAVAPARTYLVERPDDVVDLRGPGLGDSDGIRDGDSDSDGDGGDGDMAGPVAFLAQTTLGIDEWKEILAAARLRFGEVWVPARSDLCFATTNRQAAVKAMAPRCDAVVVIGSANSSNTLALEKMARTSSGGARVVRVDGPDDVPLGLQGTVGVTAGASAPEHLVRSVVARLAPRHGVEVVDVTTEDEYFPPPRELRDLLRSRGEEGLLDDDRSVAASDVLDALRLASPDVTGTVTIVGSDPTVSAVPVPVPGAVPNPTRAKALDHLGAYSDRVDATIAEVVDHEVPDAWLRGAIGYHLGWRDEQLRPLGAAARGSGGKKLRATLAVLSFRAARGEGDAGGIDDVEPVLPFAAAVELVHNWSLVHDDIEDGDRTRRGRPALWTIVGEPHAINIGDCTYALALRCIERSPAHVAELLSQLARMAVDLTVGQMRDLTFETVPDIGVDRYLEMIEGKTGALMRCSTYGGALVGSDDPRVAGAFGEFGRRLGLSFQIRDDVLGIWGTDAETGKPTGADIRRRKKSLPIVLALERAEGSARALLQRIYARRHPLTVADEQFVMEALDDCGARELAQAWARRHRGEALAALAPLAARATAPDARVPFAALEVLADFVTERNH